MGRRQSEKMGRRHRLLCMWLFSSFLLAGLGPLRPAGFPEAQDAFADRRLREPFAG